MGCQECERTTESWPMPVSPNGGVSLFHYDKNGLKRDDANFSTAPKQKGTRQTLFLSSMVAEHKDFFAV